MIYLDNNATTRPTEAVVSAVAHYLRDCYFNAASAVSAFTGADKPRHEAAVAIANVINAEEPSCITFTSGATESNNWVFSSFPRIAGRKKIVVTNIEHPSVAEPARALCRDGFEVVEVPVDQHGVVRAETLRDCLADDVAVVSILAASNETGVLQSLDILGRIVREQSPQALIHTDATQAIGKIPVDVSRQWTDVDVLSFSGHKFHGPKGIGGIYIRPGVKLKPMHLGGGQEGGLRSGTVNTPALAGLAVAAREIDLTRSARVAQLRDDFEERLLRTLTGITIHSRYAPRLPNTSCFSIPKMSAAELVHKLAEAGIIVGTGSACSSGSLQPPKAVVAMGTEFSLARGTIRVSLSADTTRAELNLLNEELVRLSCIGRA